MPSAHEALRAAQSELDELSRELEKVNTTISRNEEKRDVLEVRVCRQRTTVSFIQSLLPEQLSLPVNGKGLSLVPEVHEHKWGDWKDDVEEHLRTRHCGCGRRQHECIHELGEAQVETWETEFGAAHRVTRKCRRCPLVEVGVPHDFPKPPETPEEHAEPFRPTCSVCGAEPDAEAEIDICKWRELPAEPVMDEQAKRLYYGSAEWNADKRSWEALTDEERDQWKADAENAAGERHYLASPLYALTQEAWTSLNGEEQETWIAFALGRAITVPVAEEDEDEAPFDTVAQLELPVEGEGAGEALEGVECQADGTETELVSEEGEDAPDVEASEQPEEDAGPAAAEEAELGVETETEVAEQPQRRPSRPRRTRTAEPVEA